MEQELWKDILGYEGLYQVSSLGNVKSAARIIFKKMCGGATHSYLRKGRIMSADCDKDGYRTVQLCKNKIRDRFKIHRLVCFAFHDNPDNKPFVNHIDNNPSNNHSINLEWVTPSENVVHSVKQGRWAGSKNIPADKKIRRGELSNTSKLTRHQVIEIRGLELSNSRIAAIYGVSKTAIRFIKIRKNWAHV